MSRFSKSKSKDKKRADYQNQVIQRKNDEIESLKIKISELQISCDEKDELVNSIDYLRKDFQSIIEDLKKKGEKYDELNADLMQMRKVLNQTVFKGRWRIIKWLMK